MNFDSFPKAAGSDGDRIENKLLELSRCKVGESGILMMVRDLCLLLVVQC
jgi:hypothetical protein